MTTPLIETKFFAPSLRPGLVPRPRLMDVLDGARDARLVLLSAPPGFGKSTLLADWLSADATRLASTAWVSLEPADTEPRRFWTYVVAALARVLPEVGGARDLLDSGEASEQAVVDALVNALHQHPGDAWLVLDDYHVIETSSTHEAMARLIDHLPPHAHVVVSTRADPPWPLARLRARGELLEVRARDLRFTAAEARAYLTGSMGLALGAGDVDSLEERTEGWIAALQLAALSLRGRPDASAYIAGFSGDDRHIVDYLVDEVLQRQDPEVREFLLDTSILDRLCGPLCDAVTGRVDGQETLQRLERANLFLIPLDDRRQWYRYHHLFADVLRTRLRDERPTRVREAHRRASTWFESDGTEPEAIRHAIAGDDIERAADLIEEAAHDLRATRQEVTLRRWLDSLPEATFDVRPVLAIAHAGALLATGETRTVERRLEQAARWVAAADGGQGLSDALADGMRVRRHDVLPHLAGAIGLYRAGLARSRGDAASTVEHARTVLASTSDDQPLERGGAAGTLGLALWSAGDLAAAHDAWSEAVDCLGRAGHDADVLGCSIALAEIRWAQGRLSDARRTYERGLRLGLDAAEGPLRGTVDMHVGLAGIALERDELPVAQRHLDAAAGLGAARGLPQSAHRLLVATAGLRWAMGDHEGAIESLDDAERRYDADMFPDVRPIPAMRARMWVALGRLDEASRWAHDAGVAPTDDLSFLREYEHATLARLLIAQGADDRSGRSVGQAVDLARRLETAALAGGRHGSRIDILLALATGSAARGDRSDAVAALGRALDLAAPEGWVGPFRALAPQVRSLLRSAGDTGHSAFVGRILANGEPTGHGRASQASLVEPMSERELEVLRALRSDLDGPAIASQLHISPNTFRTHTRNVYAKLGVNDRRAAVRAAGELGLL
ncbi:MAG: LuxR C-terminal-related transcriptional regulator [Chloroflexota bacterium]